MWRTIAIVAVAAFAVTFTMVMVANLSSRDDAVEHRIRPLYGVQTEQFKRTMSSMVGPPLVSGNSIAVYQNGAAFAPMLDAIKGAQRSITFETYIYWEGETGRSFAEAMAERARAGVRVHVLLDWVGSQKMNQAALDIIRSAGGDVRLYRPLRWYNLNRMNNRTHRKLLVVDGQVGFTGGVGIADQWRGDASDPTEWRDSHFKVEGPVVAQIQAAFMDNWTRIGDEVLHGENYFPELASMGSSHAQMFVSSPEAGSERARLLYLLSIAAAQKRIRIATAYFVPDELTIEMLVSARKRGVQIELIVPGPHVDFAVTRRASRALWEPLLASGVSIHEFQPTMFHTKVLIVDDVWVSVGSTNFDNRSFKLNDEANLDVYDSVLAQNLNLAFDHDLARSKAVTLEGWRTRPLTTRLKDRAASLLRWQL
ncbi:MAG TPA: phospholipase D-like domain-containing protein [Thermoanaerobaculia bacterium]|nr:phospholipase D-like domain-containing protein [Thermoanaerobaculia bacterium]